MFIEYLNNNREACGHIGLGLGPFLKFYPFKDVATWWKNTQLAIPIFFSQISNEFSSVLWWFHTRKIQRRGHGFEPNCWNPTTTLVDLGRCPNDEGKLQLWWENTVKVGEFLVWESEVNDGEEKWASIRGKKADWEESSNLKIMTS